MGTMIRALLFCCLASLALVTAISAVVITGPVVITAPGTYEVGDDIRGTGENAAIEIMASNVVLEGNGHVIIGNGARDISGVLIKGRAGDPADEVVLRNLSLRSWQYGVHAIGVSGLVIDRVTARGNSDHGFYLFSVNNSTVRNCTSGANGGSGLVLSDVSQDNVVENCNMSKNEQNGLMLIASSHNRLVGNTIRGNGAYGIDGYLARENVIADNLFVNANNTHIEEFDRNTWSPMATGGPNIAGGPKRGGNFWGAPDGRGFSEITPDANGDGFCDTPFIINEANVDKLPLKGTGEGAPTATAAPGIGVTGTLAVLAAFHLLRSRRC